MLLFLAAAQRQRSGNAAATQRQRSGNAAATQRQRSGNAAAARRKRIGESSCSGGISRSGEGGSSNNSFWSYTCMQYKKKRTIYSKPKTIFLCKSTFSNNLPRSLFSLPNRIFTPHLTSPLSSHLFFYKISY